MKTIHKKLLAQRGETVIPLPAGAFITRVDMQDGEPHAWVFTDDAAPNTQRVSVRIIGTGREIPEGYWPVCTFLVNGGEFVWHAVVRWEAINV